MSNELKAPNGIDLQGNRAINVSDPIDPTDAANKQYTDEQQRVFVQQSDPGMSDVGLWFELNPDDTLKTLWVENGV
jgi:hypothetical protein